MTSHIQVGKYIVKPHSVKWRSGVMQIIETCTISLPRASYVKNKLNTTEDNTRTESVLFAEGDPVIVQLGYDNRNTLRFKGFVKRINQGDRLELECEGYNYQLPKVFSKSYAVTTLKTMLTDLTIGTDIQLAKEMADVKVSNVRFKNATGLQVLEWIKKELHLAVTFHFDTLYAGTLYGWSKKTTKLRLGYNTVDDKDFKQRKTDANILIQLVAKDSAGTTKKTKSDEQRYSQTKEVKIKAGLDADFMKQIANDLQSRENYRGYEGSVTCFLEPTLEKSSVVDLESPRFPDKAGLYFVENIEGSFDANGGRQKITLNYFGYGK